MEFPKYTCSLQSDLYQNNLLELEGLMCPSIFAGCLRMLCMLFHVSQLRWEQTARELWRQWGMKETEGCGHGGKVLGSDWHRVTQNSHVLQEKPCCWILNTLICFTPSTYSTSCQSEVPWTAEPGSPPPALGVYPAGHPAAVDHGRQWRTRWNAVVWNSWNPSRSPQKRWKQYAAGHPSLTAHAAAG